jgi:DNA primase
MENCAMEFVEQLKSSVDIVEVVGQYVRLKKAGTRWVGLCPFHTEKTPSFGVHAVHQFYKCFGCGAGGDVIRFVMEIEGLTFYEALKQLAERHGIPMPKRSDYSDPQTKLRAALYRMHEIARDVFRSALASGAGDEARAYLAKRGVAPATAAEFELGYADGGGQALVRAFEKERFAPEEMEASGLVLKREQGSGFFDRFRNRLMFPIRNEAGKIIAFGGRALAAGQEPKYLNSPETEIYRKGRVLYNLDRAKESIRKGDRAVLVEGYMDVIGVWAAGVHQAVATCGTALRPEQVRLLRRHTERIVVNFDPDEAGMKAAERSIETLLEERMRVRVLELEGGLDPDEYVKANGAEAYRAHLDKAPGYFNWLADRARARFDMNTVEGRVAGLQFLLPAIQRLSDKLERAAVADEVAGYLRLERGLVLENFRRAAAERREKTIEQPKEPARPVERILINAILSSEEACRAVLPRLKSMAAVQQFATRRIFHALFAMQDAGAPIRFSELSGRLEEQDQNLLAAVVFSDKGEQEDHSPERALECLRTLEGQEMESRRAALKAQIREAERAGMLEEAMRLMSDLNHLDRA